MTGPRVQSNRVPYAPIVLIAGSPPAVLEATALVDTGFTGQVVVPRGTLIASNLPRQYLRWTLADGSRVAAPAYVGNLRIGDTELIDVSITELGDDAIIGMEVLRSFTLTIDHGRVLTLEP